MARRLKSAVPLTARRRRPLRAHPGHLGLSDDGLKGGQALKLIGTMKAKCKAAALEALFRQLREKLRRAFDGKVVKGAQYARGLPTPNMHERQVERPESPVRHDFDEAAIAQKMRLNERGQDADADAVENRLNKPGEVVHCEERVERNRPLLAAWHMPKAPAIVRPTPRECEQTMLEELLGLLDRFVKRPDIRGLRQADGDR